MPPLPKERKRARTNWSDLRHNMPWMAEFVKAFAEGGNFNGRRALANMSISPLAESDADAQAPQISAAGCQNSSL